MFPEGLQIWPIDSEAGLLRSGVQKPSFLDMHLAHSHLLLRVKIRQCEDNSSLLSQKPLNFLDFRIVF